MRKVVLGSFVMYLFALVIILFMGGRSANYAQGLPLLEYLKNSSNFVPLKTINMYIWALESGTMSKVIPIYNLVGNLLLFLPMGIYLPLLFKGLGRFMKYIGMILFVLTCVESIQIISRLGRFDVDDLLLNTAGAVVGFMMYQLVKSVYKKVKIPV